VYHSPLVNSWVQSKEYLLFLFNKCKIIKFIFFFFLSSCFCLLIFFKAPYDKMLAWEKRRQRSHKGLEASLVTLLFFLTYLPINPPPWFPHTSSIPLLKFRDLSLNVLPVFKKKKQSKIMALFNSWHLVEIHLLFSLLEVVRFPSSWWVYQVYRSFRYVGCNRMENICTITRSQLSGAKATLWARLISLRCRQSTSRL